jgi:hypothetical protein
LPARFILFLSSLAIYTSRAKQPRHFRFGVEAVAQALSPGASACDFPNKVLE